MLPLEGITVVEIAQNLAGPIAAEILASMGADVVKIERPEGDDARRWGPPFWNGVSPGFLAVNANKRSVTLDLKKADDVEWLMEYIGRADVLIQNLRPGSLEELGLGANVLTARYPRLVLLLGQRSARAHSARWLRSHGPVFSGSDDERRRRRWFHPNGTPIPLTGM